MTPPIWLDAAGRRSPTRACWTCGREVPVTRLRTGDLRPHGWEPGRTLFIPSWCGCSIEYLPVPVGAGKWLLVHCRRTSSCVRGSGMVRASGTGSARLETEWS